MSSDLKSPNERVYYDEASYAFIVNGYEEATAVLRNPGIWSSDPRIVVGDDLTRVTPSLRHAIVLKDPPEHSRLRSLMNPAFGARVVERLRSRVSAIVDTVLDGLEDREEANIISDIGGVVPPSVIAELFDLGLDGAELILQQAPRLVRWMEMDAPPEDVQSTLEAEEALRDYLMPILEKRRQDPGDDFLSALVSVEDLTFDEILTTCYIMLAAGGESTGRLIGNATLAILRDRSQIPHLLADPARAVEELLRTEGTSRRLIRFAAQDGELEGLPVSRGQFVFVNVMECNRDTRRAPDADRMDLSREPLGHITLGVGPHYCLGAGLARQQTTETLVRLFTRFPDLALADEEPEWSKSTSFRGLRSLPVRLRG